MRASGWRHSGGEILGFFGKLFLAAATVATGGLALALIGESGRSTFGSDDGSDDDDG